MTQMKAGFATLTATKCPLCKAQFARGEPVVAIIQGPGVAPRYRTLTFHDSCVRMVLPAKEPAPRKPRREKPVVEAAPEALSRPSRAQTLAWLAETAPDSDLMRWKPTPSSDSLTELV